MSDKTTQKYRHDVAQSIVEDKHPVNGVLERLESLAATFGSHAEGEIKKLINEARALLP